MITLPKDIDIILSLKFGPDWRKYIDISVSPKEYFDKNYQQIEKDIKAEIKRMTDV